MPEKFSLKDELFNPQKVKQIATEIKSVYQAFEQETFEQEVTQAFKDLELKQRITHIRNMLKNYLPNDYQEAVTIILRSLPAELDPKKTDDDFGEFIYAPYGDFIATFGCREEHLEFSLHALVEITKRFSVEFAIRDFINNFPTQTLTMLTKCSQSENYHVRRLVSEGTRPKLPWGKKLTINHTDPIEILDKLYSDSTRFVTRSVANHLNDISKIDANLVIQTLQRWQKTNRQNPKEMEFIINHALRSLIKNGNPKALELLGYSPNPNICVHNFQLMKKSIYVGEALEFSLEIEAKKDESLMVDYVIYFQTKAGKLSPKVYKLKKLSLKQGEKISLSKQHLFKANMTTKKLYEGEHKVSLQINGNQMLEEDFSLYLT